MRRLATVAAAILLAFTLTVSLSAAVLSCSHANTYTIHTSGVPTGYGHWIGSNVDAAGYLWKHAYTYKGVYSAGKFSWKYVYTNSKKCNRVA